MRLVRLELLGFQGIEHAALTLGPGLNVLYGPNDLGKSTLATAIRAALLVPPGAAEARHFVPWHRDEAPRVRLELQDAPHDAGRYWQVRKSFGEGSRASAELLSSKDGRDFTLDTKGREVEDQLRKLLRWGVPAASGKHAPRKLPETFLARVLLAPQTEVGEILEHSLGSDPDETGKLRLTEALAALAQDPTFKHVLTVAQSAVARYFSPTGGRRRGKESPFTRLAEDVRRLKEDYDQLRRQDAESRATEATVIELQKQQGARRQREQEATQALERAEERRLRASARAVLEGQVVSARAELDAIDARGAEVQTAASALAGLEAERAAALHDAAAAAARLEQAGEALRRAEDVDRRAAEAATHELALERARLERELGGLRVQELVLGAKRVEVERRVTAEQGCEAAQATLDARLAERAALGTEQAQATTAASEAERDLGAILALMAYGKWRAATQVAERVGKERDEVARLRAAATELDAQATQLDVTPAGLPSGEELAGLRSLWRDLDRAEAALGGGLSITVRPTAAITLVSTLDGVRVGHGSVGGALTLEAQRTALLDLRDLAGIEIRAGAPEQRAAARALRERWEAEGGPALARAGAADLPALERTHEAAQLVRTQVDRLRGEARAQRERAAQREASAAALSESAESASLAVARRKAELDTRAPEAHALEALARRFAELGPAWESALERSEGAQRRALDGALDRRRAAEHQLGAATARCEDAAAQVDARRAALGGLAAGQENAPPARVALTEIEAQLAEIAASRARLEGAAEALDRGSQARRAIVAAELAGARTEHTAAHAGAQEAERRRDHALATEAAAAGRLALLRAQLAGLDRDGAEARVTASEHALRDFGPAAPISDADVAAAADALRDAERARAEVEGALQRADGGLQKVGGAAGREALARVKDAYEGAIERERELGLEAESWSLLRDVLREVENEEGTHLGRALAGPITARLRDLTGGRYGEVALGPALETQGLHGIAGAPAESVLDALSVGTKDQLATLLRITIAQELRAAIVLDDHLVHTDPARLAWFRRTLREAAATTQVIVITCRPEDYLTAEELPRAGETSRDLAGGAVRAVDLGRTIQRWPARA